MIPDPENEPDFERISKVFPLPDAKARELQLALAIPQVQGATNNNWASSYPSTCGIKGMISSDFSRSVSMSQQHSIVPSMTVASALEAVQAQAAKRVKDAVAVAFLLEAERENRERQNVANVAIVMKFAAQWQPANPGIPKLVESMLWKTQNNFAG